MQQYQQCFQHIYSCKRKGFSVHGLILLWDPGILLRVCTILVNNFQWINKNKQLHVPHCMYSSYWSDEKIKLWLFLPGQHSSVVEKAQHAVAKLRGIFLMKCHRTLFTFWFHPTVITYSHSLDQIIVVLISVLRYLISVLASGFWVSPGDSEEVASAISQALRNSIERLLRVSSVIDWQA